MSKETVAQVRRFTRTVTQRIGILQDKYLATDRSLGASRLLYEIGEGAADVRSLRGRLDLDSGYVSRLLRVLEDGGLVTLRPDADDRRVRIVELTSAGRRELAMQNQRADQVAETILTPLTPAQRERLGDAMAEVERLMLASLVEIHVADPSSAAAQHCLTTYFAELAERYGGFDPAASRPLPPEHMTPPSGLLVMASLHEEPVGCGALQFLDDGVAAVKRMWVAPAVRGVGVGRRILADLEERARARDIRVLRLETKAELYEAIGMYLSFGYREVEPFNDEYYADHWFEKKLSGE
ncbi:GNAT family N-acetyltransferase [Streptomyces chartreusis]